MNKKMYSPCSGRQIFYTGLWILLVLCTGIFKVSAQGNSNPFGFEDGIVSSWVTGSSTESVSISSLPANVRTGANSLQFATTSTSSNKYIYSNTPYGAAASGTYVHFIYWAKGTDAVTTLDASMRYGSSAPPSGAGSTANGTAAAITSAGWTRLSYAAGNSNNRWYFPSPRRTSGNVTTYYMDDGIIYTSSSSTTDLTDPSAPTASSAAATGNTVNLSWTSATDAGTGVQATLILRTAVAAATAPDLNDQGVYSVAGGASGPSVIGDWTVISATTGATATTYADAGVANGTYKYAIVLRDLAYNYSAAEVTPAVTVGSATTPVITVNQAGFNGAFGNVVMGGSSTPQQYTVSGTSLAANVMVTAPAGFQVAAAAGGTYGSTLSLAPVSGTLSATPVFVRYAPAAATGATGSLTITNASAGAVTQNVTVSGNALAIEPAAAGTITFGTTTTTTMVVNLPTVGNGSKRIIVVRQGSAPTFTPADAASVTGVNAGFTTATDQGSGNKIVYDGSGSGTAVVTVTGLTAGNTYYFIVYEYNEGTGTSQNYLLTPAASGSNSTSGLPAPAIAVVQGSFTGLFGNTVTGTNSAAQQYTVSGANLTADITITAPAGFQLSTSAGGTYTSGLTLAQTGGTVAATAIFARYAPTAATGATGSLNITHTSTGATAQNLTVSGNALAMEPTTAGTISTGAVTANSIVVNLPVAGNGSRRMIVIRAGAAVSYIPADGVAPAGVNAAFGAATDQGGGNKIVYDGAGSGNAVVTVTGLSAGTTYHFAVYEYNAGTGTSQNYLGAPAATANATTIVPTPVITLTQGAFTGTFGDVVVATTSAVQQYSVSGINLTAGIIITAPAGFQVSTSPSSGYTTAITLAPVSGTVGTTSIYVRYAPSAATGATGSLTITNTSTGAVSQSLTVSGNALATEPTASGTISFGTATVSSIVVNLPAIGNGSKRIIVARQGAATGFTPTDGVAVTGVNADFSLATDQGSGNKIIYNGNGSGNGVVTVSGLSAGTTYYFTVFEYNEGTGTSQNYRITPAASGNAATIVQVPLIAVNLAGFTADFGKVAVNSYSATKQYTLSGTALTSDVTITAPAGFEVSSSATSGFSGTLTIPQVGGSIAATPVYVRFAPLTANGLTGNLVISNASAPATTQNVTVYGTALAVEPTAAGSITFGQVTDTTIEVHLPTVGNGARRMIVASLGAPAPFVPTDAVAIAGVNANYNLAADQGAGDRIIYDGTGSGNSVVTMTGLIPGMLYYFTVYEYNVGTGDSYNYLTNPAPGNNMTTSLPNVGVATAAGKQIRIFPNPAKDQVHIEAPGAIRIWLTDAAGHLLQRLEDVRTIEVSALPAGIYMLHLTDAGGRLLRTEKFTKING